MATMGSGEAVLYTIWRFCVMFFASAGIGVAFALLSALLLKYVPVREYTSLELCIIIIFIYAPYTLAEGIHLSGNGIGSLLCSAMQFGNIHCR